MKRKSLVFAVLFVAFELMAGGCRSSVPIVNFKNIVWTRVDNRKLSKEQVRQAILRGIEERHWVPTESSDGRILATIHVRGKHTVVVAISYTENSFNVVYKSSKDMNYKKRPDGTEVIHPNYNRWVQALVTSITNELSSFGK